MCQFIFLCILSSLEDHLSILRQVDGCKKINVLLVEVDYEMFAATQLQGIIYNGKKFQCSDLASIVTESFSLNAVAVYAHVDLSVFAITVIFVL